VVQPRAKPPVNVACDDWRQVLSDDRTRRKMIPAIGVGRHGRQRIDALDRLASFGRQFQ